MADGYSSEPITNAKVSIARLNTNPKFQRVLVAGMEGPEVKILHS
jgi:hypothetical protein